MRLPEIKTLSRISRLIINQFEATLEDGRHLYIRHKGGQLTVEVVEDIKEMGDGGVIMMAIDDGLYRELNSLTILNFYQLYLMFLKL
jgi:hypothetical protein